MRFLTTGQLAKRAGVHVETVRFYERRGLLAPPSRRASGYRQFTEETVRRLGFIRRAQQLGFTLGEIQELLAFQDDPGSSRKDVRARAAAKVEEIDAKIRDLQAVRAALAGLTGACHGDGPLEGCPIIDALHGRAAGGPPATNPDGGVP